ncbi:MAG TPA: tRNA(His) guanylyltransferase Thg1 family protein [Methanobacterium sp.]|jgi:tRNA(His) 5'-end guanylyltransferase|nr:MAG: guanylyltransferase [Methanobacterium sp.]HOI71792.1 tRNA(His) guanylyltransferase Thg1 family protein [Methanobacterium sp.]HPX78036.1 tRNA(His) guanylyltransferase Thg1 family protein [Methanobacterium sp.]
MKDSEIYSNLRVPQGSRIIIRVDGRNFSKLALRLDLENPYDMDFVRMMAASCKDLFIEFSPSLIYTFSDEINILLDELPFSGRVEKLNSVFASFITGSFTREVYQSERFSKQLEKLNDYKSISFDSRVIPIDTDGMMAYFKEKQNEAWGNCLNSYAYWTLLKEYGKEMAAQLLKGKKKQELHDLLFKRDIHITDAPTWQRRGVAVYREKITVEGYNPIKQEDVVSHRWKPYVDWDLPLFNREFFLSKGIIPDE